MHQTLWFGAYVIDDIKFNQFTKKRLLPTFILNTLF